LNTNKIGDKLKIMENSHGKMKNIFRNKKWDRTKIGKIKTTEIFKFKISMNNQRKLKNFRLKRKTFPL
jgi:hypothetical protein